ITAPYEQREGWFLKGRNDGMQVLRTPEAFKEEERLVNSGTELWQENVEETLKYAIKNFVNIEDKLQETIDNVIAFINEYVQLPRDTALNCY
ncbi:MAG TPA: hypothetical protein VLB02_02505, partial [Candidatus Paceibacterota bacterium]|nr:hypothetical protein [Candidatus Paceibacterota bacterium]